MKILNKCSVVVGNIGTVYDGESKREAMKVYSEYVKISKANYGKAGGECVTMFCNGEIEKEYAGTLENDDY